MVCAVKTKVLLLVTLILQFRELYELLVIISVSIFFKTESQKRKDNAQSHACQLVQDVVAVVTSCLDPNTLVTLKHLQLVVGRGLLQLLVNFFLVDIPCERIELIKGLHL